MQLGIEILAWILGLLTLAGLYKPWWVLWWMSHQNRKKVLQLYGIPFLVTVAALVVTSA